MYVEVEYAGTLFWWAYAAYYRMLHTTGISSKFILRIYYVVFPDYIFESMGVVCATYEWWPKKT